MHPQQYTLAILLLHSFVCFSHPQQLLISRGKKLLDKHKIDAAITHLNYALEYDPKNQEALLHRANASFFKRDYAQATFYYRAFLSVHPHHIHAWFNLSKSLNELGYFDESQQILETLAEYNPTITIVKKKSCYIICVANSGIKQYKFIRLTTGGGIIVMCKTNASLFITMVIMVT